MSTSAGTTPIPSSGIMKASSAMLGIVWSNPTPRMTDSATLRFRSSASPSGRARARAPARETPTSSR